MISIVCVYNNEKTFRDVLLTSLKRQTTEYELIALDNSENMFKSAAQAFNYGGEKAKGDLLMFIHQDMWLDSDSWLMDAEMIINSLLDFGVAGVAGVSDKGRNWQERAKFAISVFDGGIWDNIARVNEPIEVQILDECMLIIPKAVFKLLKFDEELFDGWDCYGADYCLSLSQFGLKSYVIPIPCSHSCRRAGYRNWEFRELLKYQKRLQQKHAKNHLTIHTWMGDISRKNLLFRRLMQIISPGYLRLFPDTNFILEKELVGCNSLLELSCGHNSPVHRFNISFSVGVDSNEILIYESRRKAIHSQYILAELINLEIMPKSFDAVIALNVLGSFDNVKGLQLLKKMECWAKKKVIITTIQNHQKADSTGDHLPQQHSSIWNSKGLVEAGFEVRGIYGWKKLRDRNGLVRFKPSPFWASISILTQQIAHYFAQIAYQLIAIKTVSHSDSE